MSGKKWRDLCLLVLLMAAIYIASSMPYTQQDMRAALARLLDERWLQETFGWVSFLYGSREISIAALGAPGFVEFFLRKGTHFFGFALLAWLLYRVLRYWLPRQAALPWSGLLAVCAAVLDEWHQTFTPGRTGMVIDVVLDSSGVLFALLLLCVVNRR
ncbi:VanZ family protein [Brevibacillus marinus]|uniref:VanZ family protein n=1 Tax=Brevibacillus marinus TaxID=2496837 RepID=UPI001F49E013|nr:VanZ family protein [Brevibacillus marinus]